MAVAVLRGFVQEEDGPLVVLTKDRLVNGRDQGVENAHDSCDGQDNPMSHNKVMDGNLIFFVNPSTWSDER